MHLSEDSFNLSTFCISQEDFNSLDTNSQSVIQQHLDTFIRIERQFEQQNQKISYAIKYNQEMYQQFDTYLKITQQGITKQKGLFSKFQAKNANSMINQFNE